MKRNFFIALSGISLLLNLALLYTIRVETPYFSDKNIWTEFSLNASGVLALAKDSSNPREYVQHWQIECMDKKCSIADSSLSQRKYIHQDVEALQIQKLDYNSKEAVLIYKDCVVTIVNQVKTFACKDGDHGSLEAHIDHYSRATALF